MGVRTIADVCNLGLLAIGHTAFVDSPTLDEETTEAEVSKVIYANALDSVLERAPWKFATRRALLGLLADAAAAVPGAVAVRDGWQYVYALPADFIAARHLTVPGIRAPAPEGRIPYELESDDTGGRGNVTGLVLVTDQPDAELVYTARVSPPALWSPLFAEALSWFLASKFALAIQKKPAVAAQMLQQFELALGRAATSQYRQTTEDRPPDSEFISGR